MAIEVAVAGNAGRRVARRGAVLVAALALAGCTQAVGSGGAAAPAGGAAPPGVEGPDLPVLSSRYAVDDVGGEPVTVRVDLNEVRVVERVLQVTFTARNTSAPAAGGAPPPRWAVADFFNDGATATDAADAVDGVYVVDPVRAVRHLPGRNPDGRCLCSGGLAAVAVPAGDGAVLTATFAAPDPQVEVVNVVVPQAGEFSGIRVQR
jgi:hypothetical protein